MRLPESLKVITDTLWCIKDQEHLEKSLEDILTPAEIVTIAERIEILRQLKAGISQREVAEKLGVSITTVTRGNRILKYENPTIDKYI